jgi:hypothetical protein
LKTDRREINNDGERENKMKDQERNRKNEEEKELCKKFGSRSCKVVNKK